MYDRPSAYDINMQIAHIISHRAKCVRGRVGCIITSPDNRIISSGYNGPLGFEPECNLVCDPFVPCRVSIHAEANAIIAAAGYGIRLAGTRLYCTTAPCYRCAQMIIQAGISEVVYDKEYTENQGILLLQERKIIVNKYEQVKNNRTPISGTGTNTPLSDNQNLFI